MTQVITPPVQLRASAPFATLLAKLGPLAELPGTWMGRGFNLISLPDFQKQHSFRLKLNATQEALTFTSIGAPIPNRGFFQNDIFFVGLHYFQQISDAFTSGGLHVETGMWLHVPETTAPAQKNSIVRLSTIPHGDSLLAQGHATSNRGFSPPFASTDALPFTLDPKTGARVDVTDQQFLAPFDNAQLPSGIPARSQFDPGLVLTEVLRNEFNAGQTMDHAHIIQVDARPVGGINDTPVQPQPEEVGGIVNMPFVRVNANVSSFSARFFIETMQDTDGRQYLQLQYIQTVILEFENLLWPHISVGTLVKQ
ncbi:hypothetical protein KSF_020610 [Reticulibacter mediterranei]|uniref:Uncharacterized protein n=1 Tax=Reticulibacter mediterranei TaxID=2778369 RepID=A0A8J3IEC4_9CHLR|nr:heme-binding protein [Reticulibacter mediterranei]GHO92013.1 hypothetical protein KSF_020610 [Reticulibacter mediterranei]